MLTVHHLNNSRSQRILWLLEELEVPYRIERYERDPKTNLAPDSLKAVHPLGRSPVLEFEDGSKMAESGAIVEYIIHQYGAGNFTVPSDNKVYQDYLFWLHFAEGSLMPPLVASLVFKKAKQKSPALIRPLASKILDAIIDNYYGPNLNQSLRYVESYLSKNDWFAGDAPSAADIQMSFPLEALVARENASKWTAINAYVKRIHSRDAYKRGLEKGGEYDYA